MDIVGFVKAHEVMITLIAYWFFSAAVSGMPSPREDSSMFYQWAFATFHTMAGSIGRVMAQRFPGLAGSKPPNGKTE